MAFLASHPEAGAVVPGSGGCRKIRWSQDMYKIAKEMNHATH